MAPGHRLHDRVVGDQEPDSLRAVVGLGGEAVGPQRPALVLDVHAFGRVGGQAQAASASGRGLGGHHLVEQVTGPGVGAPRRVTSEALDGVVVEQRQPGQKEAPVRPSGPGSHADGVEADHVGAPPRKSFARRQTGRPQPHHDDVDAGRQATRPVDLDRGRRRQVEPGRVGRRRHGAMWSRTACTSPSMSATVTVRPGCLNRSFDTSAPTGLVEAHAHARVGVGPERGPPVGARASGADGLEPVVVPGDLDVLEVADRRLQPPPPEARVEDLVVDGHRGVLGADAEQLQHPTEPGVEGEREGLRRHVGSWCRGRVSGPACRSPPSRARAA